MQSPKFPLKKPDIQEIINPGRLRSRWKEKVRDAMRHQPIPDPLENLDFHIGLDAICEAIAAEVCSGAYIPNRPTRLLSEKSKGLCRQLVIPSARDALIVQTLSDALWVELREKAPSKNAFYAPNDNRFSRMVRGQTSEYGPLGPWLAFQRTILGFAKERKYIVITDIGNYYDSISYDHLRNILAGLSIAKEHSLDLLIYSLSHMLWQPDYMPRVQVGLPQINLDAPRLLAHCFLFEIDRVLTSLRDADFARYMDDIDVGVDSIASAKRVLRDLDLSLQTRQIRLNLGKTIILSQAEASKHFRMRENAFLNRLESSIKAKNEGQRSIDRERKFLHDVIHVGLHRHSFDSGAGEKILKRCINYARQYSAEIDSSDFLHLLLSWPACRQDLLRWWEHSIRPERKLPDLRAFVAGDEIVDDHALIAVSGALVSARLPFSDTTTHFVNEISDCLHQKNGWGLYAKLWVVSKYGSAQQLMRLIEASTSIWVTEEHLSRLVTGLYPRMIGSKYFDKFKAVISRSGNPWCHSVLDFHIELSTTSRGFNAVRKFLSAPNPRFPNKISHAKFLMLCSVLKNPNLSRDQIANLRKQHQFALADPYYRRIIPPIVPASRHAASARLVRPIPAPT